MIILFWYEILPIPKGYFLGRNSIFVSKIFCNGFVRTIEAMDVFRPKNEIRIFGTKKSILKSKISCSAKTVTKRSARIDWHWIWPSRSPIDSGLGLVQEGRIAPPNTLKKKKISRWIVPKPRSIVKTHVPSTIEQCRTLKRKHYIVPVENGSRATVKCCVYCLVSFFHLLILEFFA